MLLVLVEWTFLSGVVVVRFRRAARGQPTVARRRLRLLANGAAALAVALIFAVAAGDESTGRELIVEVVAIASAVLFLAGFAPPGPLLRLWRARDLDAIQDAFVALAQATSPEQVVDEVLPRVARLVGAQGAAIRRENGDVLGRTGVTRPGPTDEGVELETGVYQHGKDHLSIEVPGGWLELFTTPYTPYFGRDELELVRTIATLLHVSLERTYAHAREVAAREALDEAQRISHVGSWRVDLPTSRVDGSDEFYRLYGFEPQSMRLTREFLRGRVHPGEPGIFAQVDAAIRTGGELTGEYRVVLPDGSLRSLSARGSAIKDADGKVVALLGTVQDVTEARRLERMRQEFVANAAHELRTPLTTVSGMATLLAAQRDRLSPAELDRAFEALGRQGQRAKDLVSSLLDLSRLDAGRVPVTLAPTDIAGVVEQALETAPPPAGAAVTVDVQPGVCAVADADRLQEVLVNLLANAYRYGGPGVAVAARNGGSTVRVSVTDDGSGVPDEFVGELFQPFARAAAVTGTPGSGLGLAISHRLADALGGDLAYERAEHGGARFVVTLKAAK